MTEHYFKCTLLSNVVLNSKLATEGNMTTLNYIPGSNFLGIVAGNIYPDKAISDEDKYVIFHAGAVSFGDARIFKNNEIYYSVPFDFMMEKGKTRIGEDQLYLQHLLNEAIIPKDKNGFKAQLKQQRSGFISPKGKVIPKVEKGFTLKSAQDKATRRSKEGAMFGFEYLKKGQEFIFSVRFQEEGHIEKVFKALTGRKRIGKSKSAEFGQVSIEPIENPKTINGFDSSETLIYAQSNLCFFDELGQPTFQPTGKQLGCEGEIDWKKSQIRTYSYSPWNGTRNTTDPQRHCILAGSVFVVKGKSVNDSESVGVFQAEGLGRIIVNPTFLQGNEKDGKGVFGFEKIDKEKQKEQEQKKKEERNKVTSNPTTTLGKFLKDSCEDEQKELQLSKAIHKEFENAINRKNDNKPTNLETVSSSQWGAIRTYAIKEEGFNDLKTKLLEENKGYLKHGVAYEGVWSKKGRLKTLKAVFKVAENHENKKTTFIAKFAGEMAKHVQKIK